MCDCLAGRVLSLLPVVIVINQMFDLLNYAVY